jgi:hypothetical protein
LIEGEKQAGITAAFGTCREPLRSLRDAIFLFRPRDREGIQGPRRNDPLTPTECDCFALLSRELPENTLCRCEVSLFCWLGRPALRHVPEKPSIPISNVFASPSDIKVLMQGS